MFSGRSVGIYYVINSEQLKLLASRKNYLELKYRRLHKERTVLKIITVYIHATFVQLTK